MTPTNTRSVTGHPRVRTRRSAYATLYARRKVSRYQYGKLDYRDRRARKGYTGGEGSVVRGCVRLLISKADDLWRAPPLRGTFLTLSLSLPLSRAGRLYDKERASGHSHTGVSKDVSWTRAGFRVVTRSGIVRVIRMRMPETQWKCNSILHEERVRT